MIQRSVFEQKDHEDAFRQKGYLILDLLPESSIESLRNFFSPFAEQHGHEFSPSILSLDLEGRKAVHQHVHKTLDPHLLPVFDRYEIILGSYAIKQPRSEYSNVGLHQDLTFVQEPELAGISLWCPLVDVRPDNGCLFVMPGSQDFNSHYRDPCSLPYRDLISIIERDYLEPLPMKAGEVLFMDNRLFHASPANQSDGARLVAAGVAVPEESQLLYCHSEGASPNATIEVYEVPRDFYLRHVIGEKPKEGQCIQSLPYEVAPLSEDSLHARSHAVSA